MKKQTKSKKSQKKHTIFNIPKLNFSLYVILGALAVALLIGGISVKLNEGKIEIDIPTYTMSEEQLEPLYEGDLGVSSTLR